jgi:two-component system, NarL family, sensor histidine kinase BarA
LASQEFGNRRRAVWVMTGVIALPVLLASMAVALMYWWLPESAWARTPTAAALLALTIVVLTTLALGWRLGQGLLALQQTAYAVAQRRVESRVPRYLPGVYWPLAQQINAVATTLGQMREAHDQAMQQTTQHLRSEQARLQGLVDDMRHAMAASQAESERQTALFANLSHELRTPLTGILGYADLLRRSALDPEQEQYLDTLDKSARGLLTMINDLLDWSRIEAGRLKLNEERFDLHEGIENVITLLAPLAYQKDLELVRIIDHDVPRWLSGDAQRLRQILTNLVSNAIKFTDHGEVVVRVMCANYGNDHVLLDLAIEDTGVGISDAMQAKLFQPFQQAEHGLGGSGLGLSISQRLAEMMGGRIALRSAPDKGTTFTVSLPFRLPAQRAESPSDWRLRGSVIWLLEAHPVARVALMHCLEFWGVDVVLFEQPEHLAERLAIAQDLPTLVVAGFQAHDLERLHPVLSRCADRRPPMLALVASASLDIQLRLKALGAAACAPKSISHEALMQLLVELSTRTQSPRPLAGRRALIADNNLSNLRYLSLLAVELGLDVMEAHDGAQALALFREQPVDFVILDARMPRLDGAGCARAIRGLATTPPPRIIGVSAHMEPEERRAFIDSGADRILLKPFDDHQLLSALRPTSAGRGTPPSRRLGEDPEMLAMLRDELPVQRAELDQAFAVKALDTARDAAHQLRGTAAFYQLAALRKVTQSLEDRLLAVQHTDAAQAEHEAVGNAVDDALVELDQRLSLSGKAAS